MAKTNNRLALLDGDRDHGSIDIGPIASFDAFDGTPDLFAPVADIFAGTPSFLKMVGPVAADPRIDFLKAENWPALIAGVDVHDLKEKLISATTYTVKDPKSGISIQFLGTGFTSTSYKNYTVLATGTVTGFDISQNGVSIATGSGYSISASALLIVLLNCITKSSAQPLIDLWFSVPTVVTGTPAVIKSSLSLLAPYTNIAELYSPGANFLVKVAQFDAYENVLNKVDDGFQIKDTVAHVQVALAVAGSALAADLTVDSVYLSNGAKALLKLTAAEAAAAAGILTKIEFSGAAIVAIEATNGDWETTGYGDALTIKDIAGVDAITGGGKSEHFMFSAHWGQATITDFAAHSSGVGHDVVTLAASEFAQGAASLLADAKVNSGSVVVTAGTDTLTLTGLTTVDELKTAIAAKDFKFV